MCRVFAPSLCSVYVPAPPPSCPVHLQPPHTPSRGELTDVAVHNPGCRIIDNVKSPHASVLGNGDDIAGEQDVRDASKARLRLWVSGSVDQLNKGRSIIWRLKRDTIDGVHVGEVGRWQVCHAHVEDDRLCGFRRNQVAQRRDDVLLGDNRRDP